MYDILLPCGTEIVPTVGATPIDPNASVAINQAQQASRATSTRTATVLVTAEDSITQNTYNVVFTVAQ